MAGVFQGKGLLLTKRRSHYYESHGFHTSSLEKSLEAVDNSVSWMLQVTWNVLSDYTGIKLFVVVVIIIIFVICEVITFCKLT